MADYDEKQMNEWYHIIGKLRDWGDPPPFILIDLDLKTKLKLVQLHYQMELKMYEIRTEMINKAMKEMEQVGR